MNINLHKHRHRRCPISANVVYQRITSRWQRTKRHARSCKRVWRNAVAGAKSVCAIGHKRCFEFDALCRLIRSAYFSYCQLTITQIKHEVSALGNIQNPFDHGAGLRHVPQNSIIPVIFMNDADLTEYGPPICTMFCRSSGFKFKLTLL